MGTDVEATEDAEGGEVGDTVNGGSDGGSDGGGDGSKGSVQVADPPQAGRDMLSEIQTTLFSMPRTILLPTVLLWLGAAALRIVATMMVPMNEGNPRSIANSPQTGILFVMGAALSTMEVRSSVPLRKKIGTIDTTASTPTYTYIHTTHATLQATSGSRAPSSTRPAVAPPAPSPIRCWRCCCA